ncbi:MAG: amidohydrolase family protein, partial [Planctomycetota bacterium]
ERAAKLVAAVLLLAGSAGCAREPKGTTEAQAKILARLLPNPQIVNAHEHLMDTRGGGAKLKLEAANSRAGITSTALVASSRFTFYLGKRSFVEHHKNNEFLCRLAREDPGKYYAFVTFHPDGKQDEDMVARLEDYVARGATGVKLYLGHGGKIGDGSPFHIRPLDDPKMLPFYEYCQANRVPIIFHINMSKFGAEARRVFDRYPDLPIIIPHFALISRRPTELNQLLTDYPSLMTDLSFGWWYSVPGLDRISKKAPGQARAQGTSFRDFVIKHQDRILFGTDIVITGSKAKSAEALTDFFLSYRSMLELDEYDFRDKDGKVHHFRGLSLPEKVVRKIYRGNWERFLAGLGRSQDVAASPSGEQR